MYFPIYRGKMLSTSFEKEIIMLFSRKSEANLTVRSDKKKFIEQRVNYYDCVKPQNIKAYLKMMKYFG